MRRNRHPLGPEVDPPTLTRRGFAAGVALAGVGAMVPGPWGGPAAARPVEGGPEVNPRLFTFVGGEVGPWSVASARAISGEPLPAVGRVEILNGPGPAAPVGSKWVLRGVTSNERYATRGEKGRLVAVQAPLGRPEATRAALIPIRKSAKWWALTQDERRAIFEERSHHTRTGLKYLPAVARRLHHCRDLGEGGPFDFVTLFDFAPADSAAFDEMVAELRASEEWKYVEREVDIRLVRAGG